MPDYRSEAFERLEVLDEAIAGTIEDLLTARTRIKQLMDRRDSDASWIEMVRQEDRPLVVELVTRSLGALSDAGGKFRRAEAEALRQEGLPMTKIATLFGVSRQRISSLLHGGPGAGAA
jgi:hypothetical protein